MTQSNIFDRLTGDAMAAAAQAFQSGFPVFLLHLAITFVILFLGIMLYVLVTPHKELRLVRDGNSAAALSLGGVIVGLSIPLSVSMATSINWAEIVLWGVATLLVQLLVFRFVDLLLPGLSSRISERDHAAATLLISVKIATALVLAAAVNGAPIARI